MIVILLGGFKMADKYIKVCSSHMETYVVPLIYTFAWNGSEFWCPFCNEHEGFMGAGLDVVETKELKNRAKLFSKATKEYIHAQAVSVCSKTTWKGEMVLPKDLPDEEKARLQVVRNKGWALNQKLEETSDDICGLCGKPFNSEYHASDECVSGDGDAMKDLEIEKSMEASKW